MAEFVQLPPPMAASRDKNLETTATRNGKRVDGDGEMLPGRRTSFRKQISLTSKGGGTGADGHVRDGGSLRW